MANTNSLQILQQLTKHSSMHSNPQLKHQVTRHKQIADTTLELCVSFVTDMHLMP
jgi:hypothetical protein